MEKVKFIFQDGTIIEDSLSAYTLPYNEKTKYIYDYLAKYIQGEAEADSVLNKEGTEEC
jgi:hypothetical protein